MIQIEDLLRNFLLDMGFVESKYEYGKATFTFQKIGKHLCEVFNSEGTRYVIDYLQTEHDGKIEIYIHNKKCYIDLKDPESLKILSNILIQEIFPSGIVDSYQSTIKN